MPVTLSKGSHIWAHRNHRGYYTSDADDECGSDARIVIASHKPQHFHHAGQSKANCAKEKKHFEPRSRIGSPLQPRIVGCAAACANDLARVYRRPATWTMI